MKAALLTAAAALMGSAMAADHRRHQHNHAALNRRESGTLDAADSHETCGCYTSVVTYWGSPTLVPVEETTTVTPTPELTTTILSTTTTQLTSYSTVRVTPSSSAAPAPSSSAAPMPVDTVTVFPTPGTYTIPASTVTVSSSTVVPEQTTTTLTSGVNTVGGVTTVVETSTTITCPYATTSPSGSTVVDVIYSTTYVCPEAGTYTIAPITTSVPASTVIVYPVPATVTPGTYTKPEQTVVVDVTSYTYVCPFATSSTSSAPVVEATTTAAPSSTSVAVSPVSSSVAVASSTGVTSGTGSSLGSVSPYAVTYTGYTHDTGACMTADEVKTELENIQANGFHALRMYSTDCNQMETVASQAVAMGLRLILGVYISSEGTSSGDSQVSDIVSWGQANNWDGVEFILLDNEAVSDGYCTASELASFVSSAKATIQGAGYTGEFSIAEPLNIWQEDGSTLCSVVDFASANLQAFFNSDTTAEEAGSFIASEVSLLKEICSTDTVFVSECGWPTAGDSNGAAVPGVDEQKTALAAIRSEVGSIVAQFSYKNDNWKSPGEYGVEQYWGIYDDLSDAE